jgi:hypothetical protein
VLRATDLPVSDFVRRVAPAIRPNVAIA